MPDTTVIKNLDPTKETQEVMKEVQAEFSLDIPDEELSSLIDKRIENARTNWEEILRIGQENEQYWLGKQIDRKKLRDFQSKIIENLMFQSVETIVPIMTSKPPEPVVQSAQETEESKTLAKQVQKILLAKFDKDRMKGKFQMVARHNLLYRLGIMKYRYDVEIDDIVTEWVRPQNIILDKYGDFVAEFIEDTIAVLLKKFPDKVNEIVKEFGLKAEIDKKGGYNLKTLDKSSLATKIKYIEFWTDEYVCWKYKKLIFKKLKNPNFDYAGVEKKVIDENGQELEPELYYYNFLDKPQMPYIFLNSFNLGKNVWDDTSLIEQGIPLQDGVNKRQRQIDDNASDNGVLVGSGDYITKEELGKYVGDPLDKIWVEHGNPQEGLIRLAPKQMAAFALDSLVSLRNSIDNVLGTHSTTRGERQGRETLGGRQILREADFGRIDMMVRGLEEMADRLYKAWAHMIKIYFTQEHYARIIGKDGAQQIIQFSRDTIENGIQISVKEGSTLPVDKISQRAEAVELAQLGSIDPISLFEKLEWPNPTESAERLFLWKNDPLSLFPTLKQKMAEEQAAKGEDIKKTEQERHNFTIIVKMEMLPPQVQQELLAQHFGVQSPFKDSKQVAQEEIQRMNSGENVPPYEQVDQSHLTEHDAYMKSPNFDVASSDIQALHQAHFMQEQDQLQQGGEYAEGVGA